MRAPHLSTGAWIFASAALLIIAVPTGVYAASTVSAVHIQDNSSGNQASVDAEGQQLTTTASPSKIVSFFAYAASGCTQIYTPPAGKGFVVSSVTYSLGSETQGTTALGFLENGVCTASPHPIDEAITADAYANEQHTFPVGLPVPALGYYNVTGAYATLSVSGYLIPASQLPAASATTHGPVLRPRT